MLTPDVVGSVGLALMVIPIAFFGMCAILSGIWMFEGNGNGGASQTPLISKFSNIIMGQQPMKLEAIIVCVGYNDRLCWTLPVNRAFFDKVVVVTTSADMKTQTLCKFWDVTCKVVDIGSATPNKGSLINEGLKELAGDGWVLQLDADVMLPPKFRAILDILDLDVNSLYGVDRLCVSSLQEWLDFWKEPSLLYECNTFLHMKSFAVGSRIVKPQEGGWLPGGYFHMWNQGVKKLWYSVEDKPGLAFAKNFIRKNRILLPEIVVFHLNLSETTPAQPITWNAVKDTPVLPAFGNSIICGSG
jgi:hypothetical protein